MVRSVLSLLKTVKEDNDAQMVYQLHPRLFLQT